MDRDPLLDGGSESRPGRNQRYRDGGPHLGVE